MQNQNKIKWLQLWSNLDAYSYSIEIYNDIILRYSEEHRVYHTINHIICCLEEFIEIRHLLNSPLAVELAIWYHDIIYNTHSVNNEEKSALLAFTTIRKTISPYLAEDVGNLIMATTHSECPNKPYGLDTKYLLDIDLAILGQSKDIFNEYERGIRLEYSWVPEVLFCTDRIKILESFIDLKFIYKTTYFRNKYETQARANIKRSIEKLRCIQK